jgi:hypothetical protein
MPDQTRRNGQHNMIKIEGGHWLEKYARQPGKGHPDGDGKRALYREINGNLRFLRFVATTKLRRVALTAADKAARAACRRAMLRLFNFAA